MRVRVLALSLLVSLLLVPAAPADAQIGGFLKKKAKAVVTGQAQEATATSGPTRYGPEAWGPALTESTLSAVMQAYQQQGAERAGLRAKRARLVASRDSLGKLMELSSAQQRELDAYSTAANKQENCISHTLRQMERSQDAVVSERARSDPAFQQKLMDATMRMAQAQAQGDAAAVERIKAEMEKAMGKGSSSADSASARSTCGSEPPKPAWLTERERMRRQSNELASAISKMDEQISAVAASGSGMDASALAAAHERLYHWYLVQTEGSNVQRFSAEENALLQKHKAEIIALFKAEQY